MPSLDWIGKQAVVNHHNEIHYHLLNIDNDKSFNYDDENGNIIIH